MPVNESGLNPIGVYRNPATKAEVGCTDPAQSDAAVQAGFRLVKEYATIQEINEATARPQTPAQSPEAEAQAKAQAPVVATQEAK